MDKEKAIAVAQDVLKHLDMLQVIGGYYFKSHCSIWENAPTGDLQDYVEEVQQGCSVCALAAGILSKARLFDKVPMDYFLTDLLDTCNEDSVLATLEDVFSHETMVLIEAAFECTTSPLTSICKYCNSNVSSAELVAAVEFGLLSVDAKERLRAIYQNVIDNQGEFIPLELEENS